MTERPLSIRAAEKEQREQALAETRAVVQSEHLSSSVGVSATEIGRKSGANFNMNLRRSLLQWMMQETSAVVLGNGTTLKGRATTLVLPFWGCLAKLAEELTGKTV